MDDVGAEADRIDRLYREKAAAELADADRAVKGASAVRSSGEELADVVLVKGIPGPSDVAAGRALAGDDGEAIAKALDALGLSPARFSMCSRAGRGSGAARARRLLLSIEAVDPRIVIALDAEAAADIAAAYGVSALAPGAIVRVRGRQVLAVDDFAASLADERSKKRVWAQLKSLRHA